MCLAATLLSTARAVLDEERLRLVLLTGALPAAFALILAIARLRDRVGGIPALLTEPPEDVHPVDLAILWSAYRKHLSPRTAYRAEIVHLARIGAVGLDAIGTVSNPADFRLTLQRDPAGQTDRDFVRFMFPDADSGARSITLRRLRLGLGGRGRLLRWWSDSLARVAEGVQRIWLDVRAELLAAFVLGVFGGPIVVNYAAPHFRELDGWAVLPWVVGWVGWLVTAWALPARLNGALRRRAAAWRAFRRYLGRFSSVTDAPAAGVVIWGRYLAYAVALGVGYRVERQLRSLDPRSLPPPWERAPDGLVGLAWFRRVRRRSPTRLPSSAPLPANGPAPG